MSERSIRRVRWVMWGVAAVLVVVVAWMALSSIYDGQVSRSKSETCRKYGIDC